MDGKALQTCVDCYWVADTSSRHRRVSRQRVTPQGLISTQRIFRSTIPSGGCFIDSNIACEMLPDLGPASTFRAAHVWTVSTTCTFGKTFFTPVDEAERKPRQKIDHHLCNSWV